MALSNPRPIYGVHSVSPYSRTDGTPYGILKVLDGSSLNLSGNTVTLEGGSQKYPWAVETGTIKAEVQLKVGEYPDFLFTLFLGMAPTSTTTPSATGSIGTPVNFQGTSVVSAAGLATVAITPTTGAGNLKFGKYAIVARSATTVDVYLLSDVDMGRGTQTTYIDDSLKINPTPLTITAAGTTSIANYGIDLTGGAGPIAMTVGDSATFVVFPASNRTMDVTIGSTTNTFPEFGMLMMAAKRGNKQLVEIDVYRCKGAGMPLGMQPNAFSKSDIKVEAFYDATRDAVFRVRAIEET